MTGSLFYERLGVGVLSEEAVFTARGVCIGVAYAQRVMPHGMCSPRQEAPN